MPRFHPRVSLFSALLLMTIAAMAIVIAKLWSEIGPLRDEVIQRRAEMGQLFITDTSKAHAIGADWNVEGAWRWRLYRPERQNLVLRTYIGDQPAFSGENLDRWLAGPRTGRGRIRSSMSGIPSGEFTLEMRLAKDGDQWYLRKRNGGEEPIPKTFNSWLDDPKLRYPVSKVLYSSQTIYKRGEPIILLCIQKANESRTAGSDGNTILVWIEEDR